MSKLWRGVIKKVPTDEMYKKAYKSEIDLKDINLEDTIRTSNKGEEYLLVRLSYLEEHKGDDRIYKLSPVMIAKNKELRILCELGEYHPVKIATKELGHNSPVGYEVACIQDQLTGCYETDED